MLIAKAIALVSLPAGLVLAGSVAYVQVNPPVPTVQTADVPAQVTPKPVVRSPTGVRPESLPLERSARKTPSRVKTTRRPAPCRDGEYRVIGFLGDPESPTAFLGVTIRCKS